MKWKDIEGYEGLYQISDIGLVWSVRNRKYLKYTYKSKRKPYKKVQLWKNGKQKNYYIHRLVAQAFIPNPNNKCQVNHKNCYIGDNSVNNLEWLTNEENNKHAREFRKKFHLEKGWKSKS